MKVLTKPPLYLVEVQSASSHTNPTALLLQYCNLGRKEGRKVPINV
jgi:hypothetical protein